jgi:hypothetical protein
VIGVFPLHGRRESHGPFLVAGPEGRNLPLFFALLEDDIDLHFREWIQVGFCAFEGRFKDSPLLRIESDVGFLWRFGSVQSGNLSEHQGGDEWEGVFHDSIFSDWHSSYSARAGQQRTHNKTNRKTTREVFLLKFHRYQHLLKIMLAAESR